MPNYKPFTFHPIHGTIPEDESPPSPNKQDTSAPSPEEQRGAPVELHRRFPELGPIANRISNAARGGQFSGQPVYRGDIHPPEEPPQQQYDSQDYEHDFQFVEHPVRGRGRLVEQGGTAEGGRLGRGDRAVERVMIRPFKQDTVAEAEAKKVEVLKESMPLKKLVSWKDSKGLRGTRKSWRELGEQG